MTVGGVSLILNHCTLISPIATRIGGLEGAGSCGKVKGEHFNMESAFSIVGNFQGLILSCL